MRTLCGRIVRLRKQDDSTTGLSAGRRQPRFATIPALAQKRYTHPDSMDSQAINIRKSAESFDDLCELTAQWLSGELGWSPVYGSSPDEETQELTGEEASRKNYLGANGYFGTHSPPRNPSDVAYRSASDPFS